MIAGYITQGFLHGFFGPQRNLHPGDSKKKTYKLLNHTYIIIIHVHYNVVACRRTFDENAVSFRLRLDAFDASFSSYAACPLT